MSDTDRAFIKAYADRRGSNSSSQDGSPGDRRTDDQRPFVSQFFSSATVSAPATDRTAHKSAPVAVASRTSVTRDRRHGRVRRYTLDTDERQARTTQQWRRDEVSPSTPRPGAGTAHHVPPPHFAVDQPLPKPAPEGESGASPLDHHSFRLDAVHSDTTPAAETAPFQPEWEVDRFCFPPICQELHQKSAAGLAELLRAVLTRAWRGKNVVAFTSFGHSEGTTTVAMCIAHLAASFSARVALLDGNIEHPTLAEALDLNVPASWPGTSPQMPLGEAAIGSAADRMVVLPLVADNTEAWKANVRQRAGSVLCSLQAAFDLVIVDAGPIYQAAHVWFSREQSAAIHTATVVRDLRRTAAGQLEDVCLRLQQSGIHDVAIVDNFRAPLPTAEPSSSCMSDTGT